MVVVVRVNKHARLLCIQGASRWAPIISSADQLSSAVGILLSSSAGILTLPATNLALSSRSAVHFLTVLLYSSARASHCCCPSSPTLRPCRLPPEPRCLVTASSPPEPPRLVAASSPPEPHRLVIASSRPEHQRPCSSSQALARRYFSPALVPPHMLFVLIPPQP